MHQKLLETWIEFCKENSFDEVCLIIPFNISQKEIDYLNKFRFISEVLIQNKNIFKNIKYKDYKFKVTSYINLFKRFKRINSKYIIYTGSLYNLNFLIKLVLLRSKKIGFFAFDGSKVKYINIFLTRNNFYTPYKFAKNVLYYLHPKNPFRRILSYLYNSKLKFWSALLNKILYEKYAYIKKKKTHLQWYISALPRDNKLRNFAASIYRKYTYFRQVLSSLINYLPKKDFKLKKEIEQKKEINKNSNHNLNFQLDSNFQRDYSIKADHFLDYEFLFKELLDRAEIQNSTYKIKPLKNKIMHISPSLTAGGAERQIVNTLLGLNKSNEFSKVFYVGEYLDHGGYNDFFRKELIKNNIKVYQRSHIKKSFRKKISSFPKDIYESFMKFTFLDENIRVIEDIIDNLNVIQSQRPSILHCWLDETSIKAAIAGVLAGVPKIIMSGRNFNPSNFTFYRNFFYGAYKSLALLPRVSLVNNSNAGALDYKDWLGLKNLEINIIRNGFNKESVIDISKAEKNKFKKTFGFKEEIIIGSMIRLSEEKQPILWLKTAKELIRRNSNLKFIIFGEGPMRREMVDYIKSNNLKNHIKLPGNEKNISLVLSIIDIFMLTSRLEGTPNVILEAQYAGLPVVSTDAGGSKECFYVNKSGILAPNFSPSTIANCVEEFINSKEKRLLAKKEGPKFVNYHYGMERMIAETINLYKK
tara:strand:- start:26686 stop:28782 length:2097 start_codon:yes stop_codon:yes gene_type:complete